MSKRLTWVANLNVFLEANSGELYKNNNNLLIILLSHQCVRHTLYNLHEFAFEIRASFTICNGTKQAPIVSALVNLLCKKRNY